MTTIIYRDFGNDEQRDRIAVLLGELKQLIPQWNNTLYVYRITAKDNAYASCNLNEEYRHASIFIHEEFFSENIGEQRRRLMHELIHVLMAPVTTWVEEIILDDDKRINKEHCRKTEAVVCDITQVLFNVMGLER